MKHTNTIMQQYCRAVRKKLPLPARQRRQLLAGLQEELAESAPDCTTLDALIAQFGTPDENAQELLSSISPEQLQTYQKQYRRRCILAAALAILLICCAALAYCQRMIQSSIAYATEHITILPTTGLPRSKRRPNLTRSPHPTPTASSFRSIP